MVNDVNIFCKSIPVDRFVRHLHLALYMQLRLQKRCVFCLMMRELLKRDVRWSQTPLSPLRVLAFLFFLIQIELL